MANFFVLSIANSKVDLISPMDEPFPSDKKETPVTRGLFFF
jgi:hypothetical protein